MDLDKKILIADDFAEMRMVIRSILKNIGFTNINEADGGKAVLRLLRKQKYDLILCDWNMPDMPGVEVLRKIRSDDELKDMPFIMITAEAQKENILEALEAGVSSYIVKPFAAETVTKKINEIFGD